MILNGNKRRIGALSTRQGGLFAPSKSGGSSSSYLCRLLQSRTPSRTNPTATLENSNGNGSLASTWDRRPRPHRDIDIDICRRQAAYGCCRGSQRTQKRPRKPTNAYQYFFREQCLELSKMENDAGDLDMSSASKSNKRRKSSTGEAIHLNINIGKTVAKQWRELTPAQRQKYEDLAEKDAERYRTEVEEYYLEPNGVHGLHGTGAGVGGPSASTGRLAAIMAAPSVSRAPNKLLMGISSNSNNDCNSLALTTVNNALSTSTSTNKTSLQSLLHERRTQLLDDLSSLNQITSSRLSAGRSALAGPVDPAVRQRLYYLSVGPGTGCSSIGRSPAIGPSPWGSAIQSSNAASASSTSTAGIGRMPTISSPKTSSTPAMTAAADGPTIERLES